MTTHTLPPNSHFTTFAAALRDRFQSLAANHELFQTGVTGDDMWAAYLASFPEGTNPIFRKRPHFDGSTDRSVIRRIGNVVALAERRRLLEQQLDRRNQAELEGKSKDDILAELALIDAEAAAASAAA